MNRLSIAALVAGAVSAAAQPYAFAHRTHLELKLACTRCHPAIAGSTEPGHAKMFSTEACGDCHSASILKLRPAPESTVAHFSHRRHAELGNVAPAILAAIREGRYQGAADDQLRADLQTTDPCQACHRGLARSDEVSRDALPRMADCLVCHANRDPPQSCLKCHASAHPGGQ